MAFFQGLVDIFVLKVDTEAEASYSFLMLWFIRRVMIILFLTTPLLAFSQATGSYFTIHYHRDDSNYTGWGLHVWGTQVELPRAVTWDTPLMPDGRDKFGIYWKVPISPAANSVPFIIHQGNTKNTPADVIADLTKTGLEVWVLQGDPTLYTSPPPVEAPNVTIPGEAPVKSGNDTKPRSPTYVAPTPRGKHPAEPIHQAQSESLTKPQLKTEQPASASSQDPLIAQVRTLKQELFAQQQLLQDTWPRNMVLLISLIVALLVISLTWLLVVWGMKKKTAAPSSLEATPSAEGALDDLTGLPTRAALIQALENALARAQRYNRKLGLLFVDLDHFKPINDTLGHKAGDYVLETISGRFRSCLRASDIIARFGGDEFVILVDEIPDPRFLTGIAQKLLAAAVQPFNIGGKEVEVTASIGISHYPHDARNGKDLIKNADSAMYKAKQDNRNGFRFFSDEHNSHAIQRQALTSSLKHALENNELSIAYQPILMAGTEESAYLEALLRWKHPDMGSIPPLQFMEIAEDAGFFREFHRWVMVSAFRQTRKWLSAGQRLILTLNVSERTFYADDFVTEISTHLDQTGLPPRALMLEISEETLFLNLVRATEKLYQLKNLGIQLVVDNFGKEWASLTRLHRLPVDAIKIDRELLSGIPSEIDRAKLVKALLMAAKDLELTSMACGVETEEQAQFLILHGCLYLQGFYYSPALPSSEIASLWS